MAVARNSNAGKADGGVDAASASPSYGGQEAVAVRNRYKKSEIDRLRDEVRWSRRTLFATPFAMAFSAWVGRGVDRWVIATTDGRVIPVKPLDLPVMSDADVLDWASKAVRDTLTIGHHDIEMRLSAAHLAYFTDGGFASFSDGLERRRIRKMIKERNQLWQASVGAPTMTDAPRVTKGVLWYAVDVPAMIVVNSGNFKETVNWLVQLTIVRVGEVERARGVAISIWNVKS